MAKQIVNPEREVEIVLIKTVKYKEAVEIADKSRSKGWKVRIYQSGFYNPGIKTEIKESN